jgi:hypothetical protein
MPDYSLFLIRTERHATALFLSCDAAFSKSGNHLTKNLEHNVQTMYKQL